MGDDVIDLAALSAGALAYRGTGAFTGANRVRINDIARDDLVIEINLSGDATPEMQIHLEATTVAMVGALDFVL